MDNRRLYEWRRQLDHELISMLSFNVSISCSIFKTHQVKTESLFESMQYNNIFLCSRPFRLALELNGKLRVTYILEVNITRIKEG